MQLTIRVPNFAEADYSHEIIQEIENIFTKRGLSCEIARDRDVDALQDPWNALDLEELAVDTGITDFARNHDHYLYGTKKLI